MNNPLASVPGLWDRLQSSGYFLLDRITGEARPSRVMEALGYRPEDFLGLGFLNALHPTDRKTYEALWQRVSDGQEADFFVEYRIRTRKGGYRWIQTSGTILERFSDGQVARFFGHDRDINSRKQAESLLHHRFVELERRYLMSESLRIASSVVTASLDLDSTVPRILEQAETLFAFTGARVWAYREGALECLGAEAEQGGPEEVSPETETLVLRVAQDRIPIIVDDLAAKVTQCPFHGSWFGLPLVLQGQSRGVIEFWNKDLGFFRSEHIWPALAFADNVAVGLFNARQYRETQEASETDALTGLFSRRRLERQGPELFREAMDQNHDLTVFMVDLDHFKTINDNHGHAEGDAVLKHFARVCQTVLRKGDLVCRYGGDEFVALLPRTNLDEASQVARRICELFKEREFPFEGRKPSLSLGLASRGTGDFPTLEALVKAADTALYRVKTLGRDGIL
ncbi:MAG TPA: diguanylate cyclase, partial [Spirochaetia bacterium]|nr:diguanylate cyclase [Spirochaetia bacterium]